MEFNIVERRKISFVKLSIRISIRYKDNGEGYESFGSY